MRGFISLPLIHTDHPSPGALPQFATYLIGTLVAKCAGRSLTDYLSGRYAIESRR